MKYFFLMQIVGCILLGGCSSRYHNNDDDLRTIPVTNNPHVVPDALPSFNPFAGDGKTR